MPSAGRAFESAVAAQMNFAVGHVPGQEQPDTVEQLLSGELLPARPQLRRRRRGVGQRRVGVRETEDP